MSRKGSPASGNPGADPGVWKKIPTDQQKGGRRRKHQRGQAPSETSVVHRTQMWRQRKGTRASVECRCPEATSKGRDVFRSVYWLLLNANHLEPVDMTSYSNNRRGCRWDCGWEQGRAAIALGLPEAGLPFPTYYGEACFYWFLVSVFYLFGQLRS